MRHVARRVIRAHVPRVMSPSSRIQQIIDHERAIYRSLTPFGFSLVFITLSLIVLAVRT
jgi:hypothetical protein